MTLSSSVHVLPGIVLRALAIGLPSESRVRAATSAVQDFRCRTSATLSVLQGSYSKLILEGRKQLSGIERRGREESQCSCGHTVAVHADPLSSGSSGCQFV